MAAYDSIVSDGIEDDDAFAKYLSDEEDAADPDTIKMALHQLCLTCEEQATSYPLNDALTNKITKRFEMLVESAAGALKSGSVKAMAIADVLDYAVTRVPMRGSLREQARKALMIDLDATECVEYIQQLWPTEITNILSKHADFVVAGGALTYAITKGAVPTDDIDVFVLNSASQLMISAADEFLTSLNGAAEWRSSNSTITVRDTASQKKIQFILTSHTSPEDVVFGFDLTYVMAYWHPFTGTARAHFATLKAVQSRTTSCRPCMHLTHYRSEKCKTKGFTIVGDHRIAEPDPGRSFKKIWKDPALFFPLELSMTPLHSSYAQAIPYDTQHVKCAGMTMADVTIPGIWGFVYSGSADIVYLELSSCHYNFHPIDVEFYGDTTRPIHATAKVALHCPLEGDAEVPIGSKEARFFDVTFTAKRARECSKGTCSCADELPWYMNATSASPSDAEHSMLHYMAYVEKEVCGDEDVGRCNLVSPGTYLRWNDLLQPPTLLSSVNYYGTKNMPWELRVWGFNHDYLDLLDSKCRSEILKDNLTRPRPRPICSDCVGIQAIREPVILLGWDKRNPHVENCRVFEMDCETGDFTQIADSFADYVERYEIDDRTLNIKG